MWKKIFEQLELDGFNVFPPTVNRKTEDTPYIVVKNGPQTPIAGTNVVGTKTIDIIFYHETYSECENFAASIKTSLDKVEGLRRTGNETPQIIDEKIKAYTGSIEYLIQRRL